jgi:monothiol glutaredoxin
MDEALKERILGLTSSNRVVLFMKGNKMFPQCGFSAHVLGILKEAGVDFDAHNILSDAELRQGLKELSNWPTYPQLYVDGKLVGGCDIVDELHQSGELAKILAST